MTHGYEPKMPDVDNPLFHMSHEYRTQRWPQLLGLTRQESEFARRMVFSLVLGALIGLERRESNRGAGIRTMSLVSLGACIFTLGSMFAFEDGTQKWDASRVSAALPSGVGFLGGALIFKDAGTIKGLTTACGVWLSCAVGMVCGGGMYFVSAFGVAAMIAMLRFGPRASLPGEDGDETMGEDSSRHELSAPLLMTGAAKDVTVPLQRKGSNIGMKPSLTVAGDE
eukprot:CAMPEP_0197665686 /NCGR_PEP_ID=MMETSP1338-20131121/60120_1 /TAXON_ID=43686 ORGANISM="Pelagodinium beii, Strain RCC1491" /NCGR_SAMPLE_ID=MMETSP1338 /ASSEMBLY_ACC=CAM_ASM_000754 /LENGTH=224 /DNA_ID=CAMNT_0043244565 /DNA_START=77 /DNA_END=751 /DNA_ORIENTATION=+